MVAIILLCPHRQSDGLLVFIVRRLGALNGQIDLSRSFAATVLPAHGGQISM